VTLPAGCAQTTLADVADTKLGKMLDAAKHKGDSVPYLRNVNVRWGAFDLSDLQEMRATLDEIRQLGVRDGDIFVCEGANLAVLPYGEGVCALVYQKALHRLRVLDEVDPDHLCQS
jgi:type I restriction enzyme, S subunit